MLRCGFGPSPAPPIRLTEVNTPQHPMGGAHAGRSPCREPTLTWPTTRQAMGQPSIRDTATPGGATYPSLIAEQRFAARLRSSRPGSAGQRPLQPAGPNPLRAGSTARCSQSGLGTYPRLSLRGHPRTTLHMQCRTEATYGGTASVTLTEYVSKRDPFLSLHPKDTRDDRWSAAPPLPLRCQRECWPGAKAHRPVR